MVSWVCNRYSRATPPDGNGFVAIATGKTHSLTIRQYILASDLNNNGKVDFADFAKKAANWLIDCRPKLAELFCIVKR